MDIPLPEYEPFNTKVIFYRIPKNASTSVYEHLGNCNYIKERESCINKNADQKLYKGWYSPTHLKPCDFKKIIGANIDRYYSFCIVRNPWDRVVSMYKFAQKYQLYKLYDLKENTSFIDFCKILEERCDDPYFIASNKQVEWANGEYAPKRIIRFENLQDEFCEMVKDLNLFGVEYNLPHENKTKHRHYSHYYNSETKKLINKVFEEDIDCFKYSFEKEKINTLDKTSDIGKLKL